MNDGIRHVLAVLGGIAAFLGAYLGLSLAVWAALLLAAGVYLGLLLLIPARRPPEEVFVAERVTAADLAAARAQLTEAAARLNARAAGLGLEDRALVESLAARIEEMGRLVAEDPGDLRILRRFVNVFLPRMIESVEAYLRVARSTDPALAPRIAALRGQLAQYPEAIAALNRASLSRDLNALEAEIETLSFQMNVRKTEIAP